MNKRAKEVADRVKLRQGSASRSFRGGRSSFYLGQRGVSFPRWWTNPLSTLSIQGRFSISLCRAISPPLNPPGDWLVGTPVHIVPVGGRLCLFVAQWQEITRDHFILSVVRQGFKISVKNIFPGVLQEVTIPPRDQEAHLAICKDIRELILKQAIVQVDDFPLLCLSPIFVIPKKSGDLRVILNLKKINVFIRFSISGWKHSMSYYRICTIKIGQSR